ncbi:shikimate dehydrogenase [Paraclostridium sordellii]|uniref:Shikimate dehydrogenase (NADP(+)) n=1 Tax=Paraclostridium sordellii TaxID=1505 RepID=A0A9P1L2M1_PARSO|nr:shikimate dehydrogenase [Paeniclostridium sordellii]MCH1967282.1 shikimate dehydrogenase [Paeniclostridium sordellii]MCR1850015.1 shikimate dehydrogenase [Paeniclostridium sordellii]MRZ81026.1 shikimate dehydrogenase [Paeniclostridium sordellii]MSB58310.1 shikimate dehydrogenase [Paeniclostridium sordellii]QYE97447.1 shikimate dehydrogenase [Paeniclostridium sordellii]
MDINSKTKTICLIGNPVEHSLSPNIHNYLFEKYDINMKYLCFKVENTNLKEAIQGVKSLGIKGCNITIPHKVEVMKFLDDIDKNAKLIGAVNTIENKNGKLIGYNTDGIGFVKSILDKGYKIKDKNIMILGAGGACRSIAVELASKGARKMEIRNRSLESAKKIKTIIKDNFDTEICISSEKIEREDLEQIDIIINTTPIGMDKDRENCPIDEDIYVSKDLLVCDIVYKPHETKFLKWAKKNNLDIVYGIDMLVNQAIYGFYIWTKIKPLEEENIKKILRGI